MLSFPQDPMLARSVTALPDPAALAGGCAYESKFDGYRALLFVTSEGCRVQSRRGHDITDAFLDVAEAAAEQLPPGVVLDGELVVWNEHALDFAELQRRLGRGKEQVRRRLPASFVSFDVLSVADVDVRQRSLSIRRQLLEMVMDGATGALQLVPQTTDAAVAREWLADYVAADIGIEGLVVKGLATTYQNGARGWQKYRIRDTSEAVVGGVAGSLSAPGHLVLGRFDADGTLHMVGTTVELDRQQRSDVAASLTPASSADHPWRNDTFGSARWGKAARQPVHLVDPSLVVEVSVDTSTDRGRWRHPARLVRVRTDLGPEEVPYVS